MHKRSSLSFVRNQSGMTLIEIMIVVAIIGGLIAVLGNTAVNQYQKSRVQQAKIQLKEVEKQLTSYNMDCGSYPTGEQGLQALVSNPGEDACPNWGPDPYVKKEKNLKDPWNRPLVYESDGATFNLKSYGRDGKEGGSGHEADISLEDL